MTPLCQPTNGRLCRRSDRTSHGGILIVLGTSQGAVVTALLLATLLGQQPAQEPRSIFRTETRWVGLQATVTNRRGELVTTLEQRAFTVYENGKPQPITLFRRDDVPVSLGLLIDNSGSMRQLRAKVEAAALAMVRASNPLDEVFVLNFNDK